MVRVKSPGWRTVRRTSRSTAFRLLLIVVLLGVAVAALSGGAAAQPACDQNLRASETPDNCHVLGNVDGTNNLRIFVADGLIGVQRYDTTTGSSAWSNQYYTYGGALVVIDGEKTALGYYHTGVQGDDISGEWGSTVDNYTAPDSQSRSGNTVTTVWTVDGVRIEQRVTLSSTDAQFYRIDFDITNNAGTERDIRFLRGEDTYLAGGDNGNGFWNADTNTIGVTKTAGGSQQRLSYTGITDPVGYRSAVYSTVVDDVESGSLENSVNKNFHDNGYALEWHNPALATGDTWSIQSQEGIVEGSVIVSGGETRELSGANETFTFNVTNLADTSQNVSFETTCPTDTNCTTPANTSIASGATDQVDVTVEVPDNYTSGTYDIVLTARSEDGSQVEGRGQLVVPGEGGGSTGTEAGPKITDFDATAANGSITVTFESEANPVSLDVQVDGPDAGSLDREDFSGNIYAGFEATYRTDEYGSYTLTMTEARDAGHRDLTDTDADLSTSLQLKEPAASASDGNGTDTTGDNTTDATGDGTPTPTDDESGDMTPTPTGTETPTPTDESSPTPTDAATDGDDDDMDGTDTQTEEDGAGFGVLVALLTLLATALLVHRRR